MGAVDHRFALRMPALMGAPSKKIILQDQQADPGVQYLEVDCRLVRSRLAAERVDGLGQRLVLPVGDLVGYTSCCCANSASVLPPRTAASAT